MILSQHFSSSHSPGVTTDLWSRTGLRLTHLVSAAPCRVPGTALGTVRGDRSTPHPSPPCSVPGGVPCLRLLGRFHPWSTLAGNGRGEGRGGAEIRAPSCPALVWQQLPPSAEATQAASPLAAALTNDHSLLLLCRPREKALSDASLTSIRALGGPTHTLFAKSGVNEFSHAEWMRRNF